MGGPNRRHKDGLLALHIGFWICWIVSRRQRSRCLARQLLQESNDAGALDGMTETKPKGGIGRCALYIMIHTTYMYIHIHILHVYVCIYIYIYIHMHIFIQRLQCRTYRRGDLREGPQENCRQTRKIIIIIIIIM